jgi:hypothetical protein
MASSYTTNKDLEKPANGDYVGDWEIPVNGNMDIIDKALGGVTSLSLTNANVTLTDSQAQALRIILTGSLSANIIIYFPAIGGEWLVYNNTTGAYTVTFKTVAVGSVGVETPQGYRSAIGADGTDVWFSDNRPGFSAPQDLSPTSTTVKFDSLGVGTAASGVVGEIRASGTVTSGYSDERLKEGIEPIESPLRRLECIKGVFYRPNHILVGRGLSDGTTEVGVLAQDVLRGMPQAVAAAPFDTDSEGQSISGSHYLTVRYERLVPLLIEAVKELEKRVQYLENRLK